MGTGPSIRELDVDLLQGQVVFVTNGAHTLPRLKYRYFVTVAESYWRQHQREIETLSCERVFLPFWLQGSLNPSANTTWLNAPMPRSRDAAGQSIQTPLEFSLSPDRFVALGGTVIFVCLQLAYHLGFSRAVLLGVDHNYSEWGMRSQNPGGRFFSAKKYSDLHFARGYYRQGTFHCDLDAAERAYRVSKDAFARDGRVVVNATEGTHLHIYPKVALKDVSKRPQTP